jgi:hypothetical protein
MNINLQSTRSLLLIGLLCVSPFSYAANLISNGSFELGTFSPPSNGTQSLPVGSTTINGWTVTGDAIGWIGYPNPWSLSASEGKFFLDLTDYSSGAPFGGVAQVIPTTIGQSYELSFDLGSSNLYGRPSAIQANATGISNVFTSALTGTHSDWEHFSMLFTASSSTTTISLAGTTGNSYVGLDNVAVNAIPVPAAAWLFGTGLIGFMGMRKKPNFTA